MTLDKENDLLSDGITEEIISSLSRIKGLKVCARTSVFFFKGKEIEKSIQLHHFLALKVRSWV